MRVFFDTNVVIASFISHGACADIFEYCLLNHHICLSDVVIEELEDKLVNKFGFSLSEVQSIRTFLNANATIVESTLPKEKISRDRQDDRILNGAITANSDILVTGDEDLLVLKRYCGVPILAPKDFWKVAP